MTHHFVETITFLTTTVADNVTGTPWKGMWAIWRLLLAYCIASLCIILNAFNHVILQEAVILFKKNYRIFIAGYGGFRYDGWSFYRSL